LYEQRGVAGLFYAEAEVFANEERAEAKLVDENLLYEFFGRQARKFQSKRLDDGGLEPTSRNHAVRWSFVERRFGAESGEELSAAPAERSAVATSPESAARRATSRKIS